jgi:hypothetical protein
MKIKLVQKAAYLTEKVLLIVAVGTLLNVILTLVLTECGVSYLSNTFSGLISIAGCLIFWFFNFIFSHLETDPSEKREVIARGSKLAGSSITICIAVLLFRTRNHTGAVAGDTLLHIIGAFTVFILSLYLIMISIGYLIKRKPEYMSLQ